MTASSLTSQAISIFWTFIFSWVDCCLFGPLLVLGIDFKRIMRSFSSVAKNGLMISVILFCLATTFFLVFLLFYIFFAAIFNFKLPITHLSRQVNVSSNDKSFTSSLLFRNENDVYFL